jgi:hypothetical protein
MEKLTRAQYETILDVLTFWSETNHEVIKQGTENEEFEQEIRELDDAIEAFQNIQAEITEP